MNFRFPRSSGGTGRPVAVPAETHQRSDPIDVECVLDLLAGLVGMDVTSAESALLADLRLDDDLSILYLRDAVVEEYGERCIGDLDFEGPRAASLIELAQLFAHHLGDEPGHQLAP